MEVIRDVKKVVLQALGKENMFEFKTTVANQFYLIYCTLGNVYYTDKIHQKTKFVWFCSTYSTFIQIFFSVITYLIYGRRTRDILLIIYTGFATIISLNELLVKPAILFSNKNKIEQMFLMTDKIVTKKTIKFRDELDLKQIVMNTMLCFWLPLIPYTLITALDMILFYEEVKLYDYMYYLIPFSGLEHYGSLEFYTCLAIASTYQGFFFFVICTAVRILAIPWAVVCHNEVQRIINELNSLSTDVEINIDNYKSIEPQFRNVLRKCIQDINDLKKLISTFRGYLETVSGIILPVTLYIEVVHALVLVSPGTPFMVRLREFSVALSTIGEVYTLCWVGTTLQETTSALSFAVYSTPWYWFKSTRKDVYILLCQTQAPIKPVALNVYPLELATFLRFCNVINSAVNIFRAYTQKV